MVTRIKVYLYHFICNYVLINASIFIFGFKMKSIFNFQYINFDVKRLKTNRKAIEVAVIDPMQVQHVTYSCCFNYSSQSKQFPS